MKKEKIYVVETKELFRFNGRREFGYRLVSIPRDREDKNSAIQCARELMDDYAYERFEIVEPADVYELTDDDLISWAFKKFVSLKVADGTIDVYIRVFKKSVEIEGNHIFL